MYCLLFGIVGVTRTHGRDLFTQIPTWALGLRTNLAFAILSILIGGIVVMTTLVGRNIDRNLNLVLGPGFIAMGVVMMAIMRSSFNVLNFGMSTCIVSFIIGLTLMAGGLYGETAPPERAAAEEHFRHGGKDPEEHPLRHEPYG